jgi:serine/threonine-protein kinase
VQTEVGVSLGTFGYIAPEQLTHPQYADHRVDVWALGVIAYECFTGTSFAPAVGDPRAIVARQPLRALAPLVARELSELVERMVRINREERPVDMREVYAAFLRHSSVRPPSFARASSDRRAAVNGAAVPPTRERRFAEARARGQGLKLALHNPAVALALAITFALGILVGVAAYSLFIGDQSERPG